MAAGDLTPARRIPIPANGDLNDVMFDMRPGDYCGPIEGYTGDKPSVQYILPGGSPWHTIDSGLPIGYGHVTSPPHVFIEQPDGSLEIRESILHKGHDFIWHGYLDAGHVWREV